MRSGHIAPMEAQGPQTLNGCTEIVLRLRCNRHRHVAVVAIRSARYSFMGFDLETTLRLENGRLTTNAASDPLDALRAMIAAHRVVPVAGLPRFQGGLVGYLGFDCMALFERMALPEGDAP